MAKKYVGAWQTLNIIDRMLKKENKEYGITDVSFALERIKSYIQKLPAADVQEVKHGEWYNWGRNYWRCCLHFQCSECKKEIVRCNESKAQFQYCPYCGAKMDGKEG